MQEPEKIETKNESTGLGAVPPRRSRGMILVATFALILSIISLISQLFFWQAQKGRDDKLTSQQQQLQADLSSTHNQIQGRLNQQQKTINFLVANTSETSKKNVVFLAEEAKHLIVTSQIILLYDHNYELAKKQMIEADQKIQEINDPSLNPIRQELNNALVALNTTPKIDQSGLTMRLFAISDQVNSLSALPVINAPTKNVPPKTLHANWREKLWATLESLREIISIRRLPGTIKPLPSEEQQLYLIEIIRLQLTQAQWAVIHQDSKLYQASLGAAKKNLQQYYSMNPTGANLINMITELQQYNINPSLPDLSNAVTLLQQYITSTSQKVNATSVIPNTISEMAQPAPSNVSPSLPKPTPTPNSPSINQSSPPIPNTTNSLPQALPS